MQNNSISKYVDFKADNIKGGKYTSSNNDEKIVSSSNFKKLIVKALKSDGNEKAQTCNLEMLNELLNLIGKLSDFENIDKEGGILKTNLSEIKDENIDAFFNAENSEDKISSLLNILQGLKNSNNTLGLEGKSKNISKLNFLSNTKITSNYSDNIYEILKWMNSDVDSLIKAQNGKSTNNLQEIVTSLIEKLKSHQNNSKFTTANNVKNKLNFINLNEVKDLARVKNENVSALNNEKNNIATSSLNLGKEENLKNKNIISKEDSILDSIVKGDSNQKNDTKFTFLNTNMNANKANAAIEELPTKINLSSKNSCEDIIKTIKFMNKEGIKELTVKINPKELGEITIKLIIDASGMKAQLSTSSKEAYSILNSNLNDLKSVVQSENIKIGDFSLQLSKEDPSFYSNNSNQNSLNSEFAQDGKSNNREFSKGSNDGVDDTLTKEEMDANEENNIINMFA